MEHRYYFLIYSQKISVKIPYSSFSKAECMFFDGILPLMKGSIMYKKFSTNQILQSKVFDPF